MIIKKSTILESCSPVNISSTTTNSSINKPHPEREKNKKTTNNKLPPNL